jgi:hypothetical protein
MVNPAAANDPFIQLDQRKQLGPYRIVNVISATSPNMDHTATHICPPTRLCGPASTRFCHSTTLAAREQSRLYPERARPDQHRAADRAGILVWLRSSLVYPQTTLCGLGVAPDADPTEPSLASPLSTILQKSSFQQLIVLLSS